MPEIFEIFYVCNKGIIAFSAQVGEYFRRLSCLLSDGPFEVCVCSLVIIPCLVVNLTIEPRINTFKKKGSKLRTTTIRSLQ